MERIYDYFYRLDDAALRSWTTT